MRLPADLSRQLRQQDRLNLSGPSPQGDRLGPWDLAPWMPSRWDQLDQEPWRQLPPGRPAPLRQWDPPGRRDRAPWKQRLSGR